MVAIWSRPQFVKSRISIMVSSLSIYWSMYDLNDSPAKQSSKLGNGWITTSQTFMRMLRPRQNGRHFTDDIFKCIFLNENVSIAIKISLKFVPKGPINNIPALVQIMAWRRPGDEPLSEPMMVSLPTHDASLGLNELNDHTRNLVLV